MRSMMKKFPVSYFDCITSNGGKRTPSNRAILEDMANSMERKTTLSGVTSQNSVHTINDSKLFEL